MTVFQRITTISFLAIFCALTVSASAQEIILPERQSAIPETTNDVPHIQIGVEPVPELNEKLLAQVGGMPGVDLRETIISLPGAKGFWIDESVKLERPNAIIRGREFAHMHPDGSLHASLDPSIARAAVKAGWATPHPWSSQRDGWEGFVMIYTPTTKSELDIVFQLVVSSYEYVTGRTIAE